MRAKPLQAWLPDRGQYTPSLDPIALQNHGIPVEADATVPFRKDARAVIATSEMTTLAECYLKLSITGGSSLE